MNGGKMSALGVLLEEERVLFICQYAQSRSKYFSEYFMQCGVKSMFCGVHEEADFKITKFHLDWATTVILLDKDIKRTIHYKQVKGRDFNVIEYFIRDEPSDFMWKIDELIQKIESEYY